MQSLSVHLRVKSTLLRRMGIVEKKGNRHGVPSEAYSLAICVHEFVGLRRPFATEYSRNNANLLKTVHPTTRQNLNSYTSEVQQGLIPDFKAKILPKSGESKYARERNSCLR